MYKKSLAFWGCKKRPLEAFGLFAFFYALNILLISILPEWSLVKNSQWPYTTDLIITIVDVTTLLLLLYVLKKRNFYLSSISIQKSYITLIVFAILAFVIIFISDNIYDHFYPKPPLGALPIEEKVITFFVEFIIAVISGPIFEELLFRGLLLKYVFTDRPILGLIISTSLFILVHPSGDWSTIWYHGVPGMVLGIVYIYTKSIKVPIAVHIALNFVSHIKLKFF
ncbi:CPBP family intramembrane glutamic endopeptidase [Staphylococcus aureus]|uniref:CPBP family intramembrane glutamic endopeptidase n=1 Tax=Staphylococcus aureus TaxID=1280 RepID=UPI0004532AF3|nr:type II CAAX endopeptidase family protein [Staphylococcus aureus]EGQ0541970.1 CPBP family intramembrane metalloprotease [Staphylococcus aureus]EZY58805.1 hypothetical protein V060_02785 [Staphylococcus aureus R0294]EZY60300.1 hypothetical protein V061_02716 [Staphylococcus aureus R0353]EZY62370.1 hypothetical protein V062_02714 [Staphylococcus aureus R0357]EZY67729.1 hypothetical protein V064_02696 [Staphylococcus aureus R0545]